MIMAAGLGTRLRPLTGLVSKPMVPVANRPVLEHILHLVRRYGIRDVIINLHYFPHAITSHLGDGSGMDMNIEYSFEEELLGTAGGVKNNEWFLGEDTFLVMSGDALTDVDLEALISTHRRTEPMPPLGPKRLRILPTYVVVSWMIRAESLGSRRNRRGNKHYLVSATAVSMLSLIHISEPTRLRRISYAVFC